MSRKVKSGRPRKWVVWVLAGFSAILAANGYLLVSLGLAAATGYTWYRSSYHRTEAYTVAASAAPAMPQDMAMPRKSDVMRTWLALF